jgi:enoyl-CoA hydratase
LTDTDDDRPIRIERRGPAAWVLYAKGPRNAWDWDMLRAHNAILQDLAGDPDARVIVLASALEGHFSVGADLAVFEGIGPMGMADWVDLCHTGVRLLRHAPKPVLAAIHGLAVGGGLEFTYHADRRFAADSARLGQPEVRIGFIPPVGATQALARLIGRSAALDFLYKGEILDAAAARMLGIVDEVVPAADLHARVQAHAEMLAERPATALAAIRRTIVDGGGTIFEEGLSIEFDTAVELAATPAFETAVRNFLAKRKG